MLLHSPPLAGCGKTLSVGAVYDRPYFVDSRRNGGIDRPYSRIHFI